VLVLSARELYAIAGLLGLAAAGLVAVTTNGEATTPGAADAPRLVAP
jgi:hypothetical protein